MLAALVLLAIVALNGRPSAFPDTADYYSQGRFVAGALGLASPADRAAARLDPYAVTSGPGQSSGGREAGVGAARSPIYGMWLYGLCRIGSLWLLAAAQALLAAWIVWLFLRAATARRDARNYWVAILVLAAGSSLPFFAGFAMPDIFSGIGALGLILLLLYARRLDRSSLVCATALTAAALAVHTSHLVAALGLVGAALPVTVVRSLRPSLLAGLTLAVAAILASVALSALAAYGVNHALGHRQGRPPFLSARILADGPGRTYLRSACRTGPDAFVLCRFKALPLDDEEEIVWSRDPRRGVYSVADDATRLALQSQDAHFTLAAVASAPFDELWAGLRNWGVQLGLYFVEDPLRNPADFLRHDELAHTSIPSLIPDMAACRRSTTACASRLPFGVLKWWHGVVLLASAAFVGWRLTRPDLRRTLTAAGPAGHDLRLLLAALGLIAAEVLINAAVCGMLAGPFSRYEARLIWIVPLGAIALAVLAGVRPRPGGADA